MKNSGTWRIPLAISPARLFSMFARTIPIAMPIGDEMENTKMDEMAWKAPKFDWAMLRPEI
jgi:hypothetical protein